MYRTPKEVWKEFVNGGVVPGTKVRPEIINSWQRCRDMVDPYQKANLNILNKEEFQKLKEENSELLRIAIPVMDNLYSFVCGSGFVVALSNANGYLLRVIGDPEALELVSRANFIEGSNWREEVMGTNAIGTAIYLDKPIQLQSYEHWCICVHVGTCSGAPIHDPDTGDLIGVLDMTGSFEKVHPHTLGMVVAAVGSIEGQIAAYRLGKKSEIENKYKSLIMESISDGLMVIDKSNMITQINQKAIDIFGIKEDPLSKNIMSVFSNTFGLQNNYRSMLNIIKSEEKVSDEVVHIQTSNGIIRCTVTTRCLHANGDVIGKVFAIQEISRVNKLVIRTYGNPARFTFADLIGKNRNFLDCIEMAIQISKTNSNVLLLGESGTGKDLFAQAIHNASQRCNQPYIAINCAAIPRDLLGSELFGYEEGAFTGAKRGGNPGKFELADGGTIFLDEIGEMPLDMQTVLLRVIEERAVTRLGGKETIPVNVRIIAATNKDLSQEVNKGNFRSDLFYRINVCNIDLPPLRERREDIEPFIKHFVTKISLGMGKRIDRIDHEVFRVCSLYDWPGNVRELQNTIERGVNLAKNTIFHINLLPAHFKQTALNVPGNTRNNGKILKEAGKSAEYDVIMGCIERLQGNMSMVAQELGISRSTLYRRLKKIKN